MKLAAVRLAVGLLLLANAARGWHFIFLADSRSPDWNLQVNTEVLKDLARHISNERPAFEV
jgi:hypothetical protein